MTEKEQALREPPPPYEDYCVGCAHQFIYKTARLVGNPSPELNHACCPTCLNIARERARTATLAVRGRDEKN